MLDCACTIKYRTAWWTRVMSTYNKYARIMLNAQTSVNHAVTHVHMLPAVPFIWQIMILRVFVVIIYFKSGKAGCLWPDRGQFKNGLKTLFFTCTFKQSNVHRAKVAACKTPVNRPAVMHTCNLLCNLSLTNYSNNCYSSDFWWIFSSNQV